MDLLNDDNVLKIGAVVAAVVLAGGPYIVKVLAAIKNQLGTLKMPSLPGEDIQITDMKTVLELAHRLRVDGNMEAVALAQQLLDAMMAPKAPKK